MFALAYPYTLTLPQRDRCFSVVAEVLERALASGRVPGGQCMALLIDEAYDFEDAWLRMSTALVSATTQSLLVLCDDAQSIDQTKRRKFNVANVGIDARGR